MKKGRFPMTFQDLKLIPPILSALRDLGYEKPSPIQEKAIPPALQGRDVLGCAQTGTGKTCAFAAPILQQLHGRKAEPLRGVRPIRALILTPTRELALQIQESFEHYGKNLPLKSAVIFGGVGQQPQVDKLRAGVDILVATPGRLQDLHDQGFVHVEKLEIFVLDEADRMLDMGFIHDVKKILKWLPQKKQTLFFSATMPPEVQGLVDSLLHDPVKVAVDPVSSPVEVIDQKLYYVDRGNKSKLLGHLIKTAGVKNALVFTRTKHGANKVATDLQKAGIPSAAIHGNKSQTARQQALAFFKAGRVKALVATDIAARGLDIEELSHVFNYNLPDVPETYVHRIGRTGRAGRGGTAISFCEFGEKDLLAPIEKLLKKPIPVVEDHPWPMQNFEAPQRDKHGKIVNADDQEARQAARERKKERAAQSVGADSKPAQKPTPKTARPDSKLAAPASVSPVGHDASTRRPSSVGAGSKPAQTTSAGMKKSPGYRPSKTLDEALTSMAPKPQRQKPGAGREAPSALTISDDPAKQAAFERWMAEERAIQARQEKKFGSGHPDEVIMDATARLLAPKEGARAAKEGARAAKDAPKEAPARPAAPQQRQQSRPQEQGNGKKKKKGGPVEQPARQPQKPVQPKKAAPVQEKKAAQPVAHSKPRPERRHGPAAPIHSDGQKDSTEQKSLMKPYYFNPNEED